MRAKALRFYASGAFVAAGGGDHSPLCRYNAAFRAELGRYVDDHPIFHNIPDFQSSGGAFRSLVAPGIARHCAATCNSG